MIYALPRVFNSTAPSYADPSARGYGCQIYRIHTPKGLEEAGKTSSFSTRKTSSFRKVPARFCKHQVALVNWWSSGRYGSLLQASCINLLGLSGKLASCAEGGNLKTKMDPNIERWVSLGVPKQLFLKYSITFIEKKLIYSYMMVYTHTIPTPLGSSKGFSTFSLSPLPGASYAQAAL